jgi:signal transduction histidine kinase/ActR/RegA family two-component response regulator
VDNLKVAYSANESLSFEETLDFTGNDPRIYQVQFTPVKADNAESDSALILMHDITEISETQRQAEEAREAAERASEAKSIFLSNMSHEMRTPLNAILGMTAIAKSAAEPDKINYSLDKIEDASSHLLSVIGDILDASMNETDKMELISVPFSLRGMIQTDVSIIRRYIEEKSQDLAIEIAAEVPETIISDELHLSQVLKNLLMNAIKFTPRRGMISLAVSLADINPTFATIRFVIKDNGIGISAEQQRNLFTPFMQADNSASRKYGGMGLGLAISERIVRRMGGEILVESEQGKGSVFSFTIAANYASDVHVETPDDFSAYRALLAEDVEINREIVHAFLETTGLQIEDAENGKVALDLFERDPERFDIIFMDIQMPEMDGLTATRRIRGLGSVHAKTVPIVAMTANVFQQDIDKCLDAGMNDHIGKPINVKVILSALHKYLRPKTAAK